MTVEETLKDFILRIPFNKMCKWDMYNHIFSVDGNGYEWVDGELVDMYITKHTSTIESATKILEEERDNEIEDIKHVWSDNPGSKMLGQLLAACTIDFNKSVNRIKGWKSLVKSNSCRNLSEASQLSNYSKIVKIPSDITDDWLVAAKEYYELLLENRKSFSVEEKEIIDGIKFPR